MAQVFVSDYFYGDESKEFSYFRIPRLLITHQRFKNVSVEAKLLYGLLLDRMGLSEEHGWYDEDGRVFIYYTVEEIADDLCCGRDKAMKLLAELDKAKGAGLIERVRQGQGKPTKIYVKRFTTREVPPKKEEIPAPISEVEILDVQKSEIPTSKGRKPRLQEVGISDPSYIDNNYPEFSYPDPSISPAKPPGTGDRLIERWSLKESVRNQIEYDALCTQYAAEEVDALVELISEIQSSTADAVRLGKEQIPIEIIKERFQQLTQMHVAYILDSLRTTTTQINNIKAYVLDSLRTTTTQINMELGKLGERKQAIFCIIPDSNDASLNFLVGMLYTQAFQELYYQADKVLQGALPVPVRLMFDEFANVALPDGYARLQATMRSRNIMSTIILQNISQLKALFKDDWEGIIGNADSFVYLGGNEQSTHKYISELLGKETIDTRTSSQSKGRNGSFSQNFQQTGRELMTPDEVRRLDNKNAIVLIRGEKPVIDEKYDILKHPNIHRTEDGGAPPYLHTPLRAFAADDLSFPIENIDDIEFLED